MEEIKTIVIDNGTSMMKAGWAGDEVPLSVFPTVAGHSKSDISSIRKDIYIGDEARVTSGTLILKNPIERGIVVNWDDMEKIYNHIFKNELRADPKEHNVLLTEPPLNPKANREKMIQLMFETFNVPSFYTAYQGSLSLYSSGETTGLVCEVGDGVTQIFPIYNGYGFKHGIKRINLGGIDVTNRLQTLLTERGYTFTTPAEKEIVRDIKENHAYIALDYDSELDKSKSTSEIDVNYTLPTGKTITFSDERFRCTEILFNPCFEMSGIAKASFESIMSCNIGARKDLYANIVLAGGTTMHNGFIERFEKEIVDLAPPAAKVKIVAKPERKYSAWIGGSKLGAEPTFAQYTIKREDYNDSGPAIAHRNGIIW